MMKHSATGGIALLACAVAASIVTEPARGGDEPGASGDTPECYRDIFYDGFTDKPPYTACPGLPGEIEEIADTIEDMVAGEAMSAMMMGGTFVEDSSVCDINCDGVVDALDLGLAQDAVTTGSFPELLDLNADGQIDIADQVRFWACYNAGSRRVDFNRDHAIDVADVVSYFALVNAQGS